jgi:hypothetical protein
MGRYTRKARGPGPPVFFMRGMTLCRANKGHVTKQELLERFKQKPRKMLKILGKYF